jgi:hypothetical protein
MIRVARRDYPGFRFDVADVRELPFQDAALAGVVCWYSLMFLAPPRRRAGRLTAGISARAKVLKSPSGSPVGVPAEVAHLMTLCSELRPLQSRGETVARPASFAALMSRSSYVAMASSSGAKMRAVARWIASSERSPRSGSFIAPSIMSSSIAT